jgi:hypothetical protein
MEMMESVSMIKKMMAGVAPVVEYVAAAGPERGWVKVWELKDGGYDRFAVLYGFGEEEYGELVREFPLDPESWIREGWEE